MKIFSRLAAMLVLVGAAFAFHVSQARAYDLTVVDGIDVKDWDPAIAYGHESYACMVYPADGAGKGTKWFPKGNADGTGPYKLVQWVTNQQIVLERNKDYWRGWKGNEPDRIIVKIVSEVSTQLQMLRSGEADMTFSTIPFDMVGTLQQDPKIKVDLFDSWMWVPGKINVAKAPTNNLKFREALTHIMDYDTVSKQIYAGLASVPQGPTPMPL